MGDFFMRKICLIGGDKRNLELAKFLLEDKENNISIFANEKMKEEITNKKIEDDELKNIIKKINNNVDLCNDEKRFYNNILKIKEINNKNYINEYKSEIIEYKSLEEAIIKSDIVVTAVPISKDKLTLTGEYTDLKISLEDFFMKLKNVFLVSGMVPDKFSKVLTENNVKVLDLLKDESYIIFNAKITVEGIIKYLIENTEDTIFNSKILVLGYGRIGKILCNVLKSFTENIYCMPNSKEELEWLKSNCVNYIFEENFNDLNKNLKKVDNIAKKELHKFLGNFEIIINTIPRIILNEKEICSLNKDVFILDVASKPGGINQENAMKNNINFLWKLGIPAEISAKACAKKIKNMIYENNITYMLQ